jgi:hypothetical protein
MLDRIHKEFNEKIEEVLKEPGWDLKRLLAAEEYQAIMRAKKPDPIRVVQVGNAQLKIVDGVDDHIY